ncbi:MAG TPA: hypothetical protein VFF59_05530, partial [Anaerolineae bacterium]|nr:hypothetical protein [Anaerolineae bacterium]
FLGVAESKIPVIPDEVNDPKLLVVNLARQSRKRAIREDLVPTAGSTSQIGKNYVGQLSQFVSKEWTIDDKTRQHSPSLNRATIVLQHFSPRIPRD